ncbi:hypothetical protein ACLB2K_009560 [Fragaria x ananassa]
MPRPLARFPLRSIAESLPHFQRRRIGDERLYHSQARTGSSGRNVLCNGAVSTAMDLQRRIVEALRLGKRGEASNLLLRLSQGNDLRGADDFVHVLDYCAASPDPLFVMEAWRIMNEKEISLNSPCSSLMVKALCEGGYLEELAVWRKNLSVAHELWKDYIKHYSLSNMTLHKGKTSVTKSIERKLYSSRLDTPIPLNCELGLKKVNLEENEQSVPSRYCENLDGHVVSADRCTRSSLGFGETESVLVNGLSIHTSTLDRLFLAQSFNDLIYACGKLRNGGLAEQLVQQRQKLGFHITRFACDSLIRAIVPDRGFSRGMEILKSMQQRNLKPYDRTLATLSISCCRALELDLAETLLDQMSIHARPHAFNAFLAAYDILDQPEHAVRMLAKMKHLQVTPNISTYEQLFSLFGNVNAPYEEGNMLSQVDAAKRIKAIEIDMASYGIQHSALSMNNVLKALGAEGMMRELIHYLHVAEDLFCRNNMYLGTRIYNTALNSLVEGEESQMAINIFKSMKSCGFRADAETYHIMIKYCKVLKCYRSACALVSMMLRDGFYPQIVTYTVLIDILLEDDSIHKALDLLDQASSEGNKLDILVFNTILRKAGEEGLIDVVEFLVGWMQQEKIQPDSTTCSAVFTAYTYCGFHSTAVEALQVLSMRMICDEDGSFPEKTQFEDDYIFAEDEGAESRIIKHFKDSEENLAFALLNLRWCAMLGFPISWLPDQSPWVKRLSTNYTSRIRAT